MTESPVSPVSFVVDVERLPAKGMPVEIVADDRQRRALAVAHDLLAADEFRAELLVRGWKRDGVRVTGRVQGRITQSCVVTLEPVDAAIETEVLALFVPEGSSLARDEVEGGEMVLDAEGDDPPETFSGTRIDVGHVAEEFFALAIDPYPRVPDADLQAMRGSGDTSRDGPVPDEEGAGPMYEALRKLARKG